ncbi:hypothetical protein WJX72_002911 [[Myrmecia] bisecta]|uniref:DUF4079 domain-containing protein n=1 Tax=[Myrmecia] bisecta TaxID=41462 RepID=A0AAW1QQC7_9CHLO
MLFLLGSSLWTGYLGWQWRATRLIPQEIKQLKAQLPKPDAEGKRPPTPLDAEIAELEQIRKDLAKGNYREKHWNWGSLLLGLGVAMGVAGPVNTYLRTGKLFPGPHLYAGAAIVVLWAAAASLVPSMQKGSDTARYGHIALNSVNIALFLWQVPTGWEIVTKVFQFTSWP